MAVEYAASAALTRRQYTAVLTHRTPEWLDRRWRGGDGGRRMDDEQSAPVEIPLDALSETALRGLVEEFVSRDGTDYGVHERSLEDKVRDVMRQLERGEAVILFDPESRSANVVVRRR